MVGGVFGGSLSSVVGAGVEGSLVLSGNIAGFVCVQEKEVTNRVEPWHVTITA